MSAAIGGPRGSHARGTVRWLPVAAVIVALTALTFAFGMAQKSDCASAAWTNSQTRYTHFCYSDLPYLYPQRGLADLDWPYTDDAGVRQRFPQAMEYPVLISYWAYATAEVTHWLRGSDVADRRAWPPDHVWQEPGFAHEVVLYVAVNAVGFAVLAMLAAWLLVRVRPDRPWDAAAFAASPALLLTGVINWDMLAVVFVAGALWAAARQRPVVAGVMIGLGTAAKLFPVLLLGGLLVLALRRRTLRPWAISATAAVVSWLVVNLPALLTGPREWLAFWTFNEKRAADWGSGWLMLQDLTGHVTSAATINAWSWLLLVGWCALVGVIGLRARAAPTLAQLGYLLVAGFVIINKVYSPQYVLWLLPLAVVARPRWRDQLIWQGAEILYFCAIWWNLAGLMDAGGGEHPMYDLAIAMRVLGEAYLAAVIVRDLLWPAILKRPDEPIRE